MAFKSKMGCPSLQARVKYNDKNHNQASKSKIE
jgi:hypothetical protein